MAEETPKEPTITIRPPIPIDDLYTADVMDDQQMINIVQKRRLCMLNEMAPMGVTGNPKDRYLYAAMLKDVADTAQSRITSKQKAESGERDRVLVQAVLNQMRDNHLIDVVPEQIPEGQIPQPKGRFTDRTIDPGILSKEEQGETFDEFRARMAHHQFDVDVEDEN